MRIGGFDGDRGSEHTSTGFVEESELFPTQNAIVFVIEVAPAVYH